MCSAKSSLKSFGTGSAKAADWPNPHYLALCNATYAARAAGVQLRWGGSMADYLQRYGAAEMNQAGLDLVKEFEGFRADAYRDPVGVWTIGYGTTAAAGVGIEPKAGMKISKAEAEKYLAAALDKFAAQIDPKITAPINENEHAAFLSLAYNIGPGAFAKSSALRKFNEGDKAGAANAILLWNKAGGKVLPGLQRRREAEKALFLRPVPAPTETPQSRPTGLFAALAAILAAIFKSNKGTKP